jgi:integrase
MDWLHFLKTEQFFSDNDPLFPKTAMGQDQNGFTARGLSRKHWANTTPVRKIFKEAFLAAGLPVFTPHRFRNMIVSQMYERKLDIAQFKAWSQSLGHENAQTTLTNYGKLPLMEQERLIRGDNEADRPATKAELDALARKIGL